MKFMIRYTAIGTIMASTAADRSVHIILGAGKFVKRTSSDTIKRTSIPDYSTMSEEELFQESTIYNCSIPLNILVSLQKHMKEMLINEFDASAMLVDINDTTVQSSP